MVLAPGLGILVIRRLPEASAEPRGGINMNADEVLEPNWAELPPEAEPAYRKAYTAASAGQAVDHPSPAAAPTREQVLIRLASVMGEAKGLAEYASQRGINTPFFVGKL